jgi:hypothetical protein
MSLSGLVNHDRRDPAAALTFLTRDVLLTMRAGHRRGIPGSNAMTFAGRLSSVTAYLAMAFVGAIVLGLI